MEGASKRRIEDLALLGGRPAFAGPIHVGRPNLGDRRALHRRIDDILDRGWLTNDGAYVRGFEQRLTEFLGVDHCVAFASGTLALETLIRAASLAGEVIVPSFTFVATAHALRWQGVEPVFCDVDLATHNLDPERVEELITPLTSAILGVHLWGRPCDALALASIARRRGLRLFFDAAHAFGCTSQGTMVGGLGDAEVFSFHATKVLNTFEGGAVATRDPDLANRLRLMRNFGFAGYDSVVGLGTNGKMTEIAAAMGLTGLESLDDFVAANRRNHGRYETGLGALPGVTLTMYDTNERANYQYVVVELDESVVGLGRDEVVEALHAENVLARRYFHPGCHRMEPYLSEGAKMGPLANTELLCKRVVALPTGAAVGIDAIDAICGLLRLLVENGPEVTRRLREKGTALPSGGRA
jgi:dTDP-4-amino-4,6-dideoxygalactose transaminase